MGIFLNDWSNGDAHSVAGDFDIDPEKINAFEVLLASYTYENYSGNAFVLLRKGSELYEVNGSHCSCYGLEGQWEPQITSAEELRHRVTVGTFGYMEFGPQLLEVLDTIDPACGK